MLTGSLAAVVGALAAVVVVPMWRDHKLLQDLSSSEPTVRSAAISRGVSLASWSPSTRRRLENALWSDDDQLFAGAADVLNRLNLLAKAAGDPNIIDRLRMVQVQTTYLPATPQSAADSRRLAVRAVVMSGHDSEYVRRTLAIAAGDESPAVRSEAALLAAKLRDANTLESLMCDGDGNVVASAALDAGLAGMRTLADPITALLTRSADPHVISACAYGLTSIDIRDFGKRLVCREVGPNSPVHVIIPEPAPDQDVHAFAISRALADANSEVLRDRLLHVETMPWVSLRECIDDIVRKSAEASTHSPAMAILAAGGMEIRSIAPAVKRMLRSAAVQDGSVTESQVIAALQAADEMNLPVRTEVLDLCRKLWSPDHPLMLMVAARVLGRQAEWNLDEPNAPSREECIDVLRQAATYRTALTSQPTSAPAGTPLPSAAAAVALWLLEPSASFVRQEPAGTRPTTSAASQSAGEAVILDIDPRSSAFYVQAAAGSESFLAADYIAWHLARSGRPEAFELGLALLPPPLDPNLPFSRQPPRTYNAGVRAAGAMLLALAAHDEHQKEIAIARLTARLEGGPAATKPPFIDAMTYKCALLALGQKQYRDAVFNSLLTGAFPMRRAVTALLASGDGKVLDWLLCDARESDADVADITIRMTLWEPLEAFAPALPHLDLAASDDLRAWQMRIIRDSYIIHREAK